MSVRCCRREDRHQSVLAITSAILVRVERPTPEKRSKRRIASLMGTIALAGVIIGGALVVVRHNNQEGGKLSGQAQALAAERNMCSINSVKPTIDLGKPALRVVVSLAPLTMPEARNEQYDRPGKDATFSDETGNIITGLINTNKKQAKQTYTT